MRLAGGSPPRLPKPRETAASCNRHLHNLAPSVEGGSLDPITDDGSDPMPPPPRAPSSVRRHKCRLAQWNEYFDTCQDVELETREGTFRVYTAGDKGPVLLLLHGAGYSGLTWALMAGKLKEKYRIVAFDQRGHGSTSTLCDEDLSAPTLAEDVIAVWEHFFGAESPPTVIIGHSMGGAIAVHTGSLRKIPKLEGVGVIDVVEGTAMAALPAMIGILEARPPEFTSLDVAFEWVLTSGTTRNPEAASISLPSQLTPPTEADPNLRWVTPLKKSQPHWEGWYRGLSQAFLKLPCPRLLILAGTDRLDKDLTIGQMQGKFQLVLLPVAGHAIQEDEPESTANGILKFLTHFQVGHKPVLPQGGWGAGAPKRPGAA